MSASSSTTRTRPVSSVSLGATCGISSRLPHSANWRRLMDPEEFLALLDWRRQVSDLFQQLRSRAPDAETLAWFRAAKDALFRTHSQSPIPASDRTAFAGLEYWPWDPNLRVVARF